MKAPQIVREIGWFGVLGGAATAINYVGALSAQRLLHLAPLAAGFVGYALSVGVSYFGNSLLTFRRPALHGPQFARFAAISLAGLAINLGVVFIATHTLDWPLWQALIPVVVIVPASTFVMAKFWAFRSEAEPA